MYWMLGIFLLILILFAIINHCRAKSLQKKICALTNCEKSQMLNELIEPFGFCYSYCEDLFSSRQDAWQRDFGYYSLYDRAAPHIQLVFDCEPIYFDYEGRTWLIELWKGQYGINTGAEIGIYHADKQLSPSEYSTALFQAVEDPEMLELSMELWRGKTRLFHCCERHWWLTGFRMGCFSKPQELTLRASITFPNCEMMDAFLLALHQLGYPEHSCSICRTTITLLFRHPYSCQPCQRAPLSCRFSQWKNKWFCRIFIWVTKPFCNSADRLLYLYYFLPFAFRRIIQICKPRRYS